MEFRAEVNHIRVSSRKMKALTAIVRGLNTTAALDKLKFLNKSGVEELTKLIKSALANAKNKGANAGDLKIKEIVSSAAGAMKRFRAASRGVAHSYKKRMSHVKIILAEK